MEAMIKTEESSTDHRDSSMVYVDDSLGTMMGAMSATVENDLAISIYTNTLFIILNLRRLTERMARDEFLHECLDVLIIRGEGLSLLSLEHYVLNLLNLGG